MGRDVPFKEDKTCDLCGALGAYDFMGDYICQECLDIPVDVAAQLSRKKQAAIIKGNS